MTSDIDALFSKLWQQYVQVTPSAAKIHQLLAGNNPIINDHIALRTFQHPVLGLEKLAEPWLALGYQPQGEYHFEQKKLYARHYEHPDPLQPKVFISELLLAQCSPTLQQQAQALIEQVDPARPGEAAFLYSGCPWSMITYAQYQQLAAESEYAAWVAAWGYRANHFTVSVNELTAFATLEAVNERLQDAGFKLNNSGGLIKGSPAALLEQSSTMADHYLLEFADGSFTIPSCFYEFARRYPTADGSLYTGFVAASADKIFESTHTQH